MLGANFVLLFFIGWHVATALLYLRQVRRLAIAICKMDCYKLIDEMLSCSGGTAEQQRYEVTAGDGLASPAMSDAPATPEAVTGQQRYKVTGQKAPDRVQNTVKGSPRLQLGVKQGGMGFLLTEKY